MNTAENQIADMLSPEHVRGVIDRFEQFVSPEPNTGCWLWSGGGEPYGVFWVDGLSVSAHRFSRLAFGGPVEDGLHIDHKCRVKCCVNPDHLEPVTPQENAARKPIQGNQYKNATHCKHGHELSGDNVRINSRTGQRVCRACNNERVRRWKQESRHANR